MKEALRRNQREAGVLAATTLAALAILWLIDVQIYNEPWTIDPWLYTALMANFDFAYQWFGTTYYAARLPLIIPGVFLNAFLAPEHAYAVLHITFFLGGALFMYLLARTLFGVTPALFLYPVVLTNAIYVDSHTWDYFDGAVITFVAAGLYFAASAVRSASRVRVLLSGFFLSAAVATNLFASVLVLAVVASYVIALIIVRRRAGLRRATSDAVWFLIGAAALLGACGAFAASHGGEFLFILDAVRAIGDLNAAQYKLPTYEWVKGEPRLLVPPFVVLGAAIAWLPWSRFEGHVFAKLICICGFGVYVSLVIWELAFSGTFLQLSYYFDTLYPFVLIALAAIFFGVLSMSRSAPPYVSAAWGTAAGAGPIVLLHGFARSGLAGETGTWITFILMVGALAGLVALVRTPSASRRTLAWTLPVAALAAFVVNYGSAANLTTRLSFETSNSTLAEADETFAIGVQLMTFTERHGLEDSLPGFWYDQSEDPAFTGLQSLYYYAYTYLNLKMPLVDDDFRNRTLIIRPRHIVLLCAEPTCRRGPHSLRQAGYRIRRVAAERLHAGSKAVWVQAYALESPTPAPRDQS